MKIFAALAATLCVAATSAAQPPRSSTKDEVRQGLAAELARVNARAALEAELHKVKAAPAAATFTDYPAALAEATRAGKPLFVAVGLDCTAVCSKLRPDMVTCHAAAIDGCSAGDCFLAMPNSAGKLSLAGRWRGLPSDAQVREQASAFRKAQAKPPQTAPMQPATNWSDGT